MPRNQIFPRYDFETQFDLACHSIRHYFDFAREVQKRSIARLKQLKEADERRGWKGRQRRYASKVCVLIAREYKLAASTVYRRRCSSV